MLGKFYLVLAVSAEEVQPFHSFEDIVKLAPLGNFGIEEIWITNFEDFTLHNFTKYLFTGIYCFKAQKHT